MMPKVPMGYAVEVTHSDALVIEDDAGLLRVDTSGRSTLRLSRTFELLQDDLDVDLTVSGRTERAEELLRAVLVAMDATGAIE